MISIIADDKIPFLKGVLEPFASVAYLPGSRINREKAAEADALVIRTRTICDGGLLDNTPVRFIATATIGFDHIDTEYCEKRNIKWTNAPGCNSASVQQYMAAALLRISSDFKISLKGTTIGIIGVGNVGSKVETLAKILGMNVLLNDPPRARREGQTKFVGLKEVLSKSDIITLHVPLNTGGEDKTYHLFGEEVFKRIKKGSWLINSARGEVVETGPLKKALRSGKLAGAILDVWEHEPNIDLDLMSEAFIATPHIAGYSIDGKANGTAMVINSLCQYFDLPLKNWYPVNIPLPLSPRISIDCRGKSVLEIIREAVFHTYNIVEDSSRLQLSPSDFEKLRGDYQVRREFPAFTINLQEGTPEIYKILGDLGFRVG
jgi:erythronate-4-phosphate dehydrogenase